MRQQSKPKNGFEPKIMIVDEATNYLEYDNSTPPDNESDRREWVDWDIDRNVPASTPDPQTPQELFDAGWITFQQYRELTRSEPLPPETQALLDQIDKFDEIAQAHLRTKIATGRSALAMQGFNTEYKNKLPALGSNPKLHQKAVERRRKRKNGGHK